MRLAIFGKQISMMAAALFVLSVAASAALLAYFGTVTTTATVQQSVLLDGEAMPNSQFTRSVNPVGGETDCHAHTLKNQASVPFNIQLLTGYTPEGEGITTKYYVDADYEADVDTTTAYDEYGPVDIKVETTATDVVWTFDMIGSRTLQGDGHWAYGLIISLDGVKPAYQIHSNDGSDANFPWGTHLYSTYDNGWHTGTTNTPVSDLAWVSATGDRYIATNPDGIFTVSIKKSELGDEFYWAAWTGQGGFYHPYATGQSGFPAGFTWTNSPDVEEGVNYAEAELKEETTTVPLAALETKGFEACHEFDKYIAPGVYTITTTVQ